MEKTKKIKQRQKQSKNRILLANILDRSQFNKDIEMIDSKVDTYILKVIFS